VLVRAALAEVLEQRFDACGAAPPIPGAELTIVTSALINGLAAEGLEDPGSVPDELLGYLLGRLLAPPSDPVRRS
jgi:hypothetical protein